MAKQNYPGWSPNFKTVDMVGGKFRTCMIIDLRSHEPLSRTQLVALAERLEATAERNEGIVNGLEARLITSEQFDPVVCEGLRLTRAADDGWRGAGDEVPFPSPM